MNDQGLSADRIASLLDQMKGLTVALATPLNACDELDAAGLERLLERVIAGGASCLFPLGWMGEQPLLSSSARNAMLVETCRIAKGRLPVMVGVSEQALPRALQQAEMAREAGADVILSTPPYSYHIPQNLIYEYFKELAAASGMPVVVYQNDEVGVTIGEDTLAQISRAPGVVGVKVYMPFLSLQKSFLQADRPGRFAVMSGDEYLYGAALFLGIRHYTMGGPGNLCPGWCVKMYNSAVGGDWDAVGEQQKRLIAFCDALYAGPGTAYATVKYALERLGVCSARISSPHAAIGPEQQKQVNALLEEFEDVVGDASGAN